MALDLITFPREFSTPLRPVGMAFTLDPMAEITPLRSGRTVAVDTGPTLWRAGWQSQPLVDEDAGVVQSWYDTILSYKTFLAYHHLRQYPLAYKATGWPTTWSPAFDGIVQLSDVNDANMVEVTFASCPVGLILSVGDFFGFRYSDRYALHRIAQGGIADGSGMMTVEVRPEIQPGYPIGSNPGDRDVTLYRAPAEMFITPGSWRESLSGSGDVTSISFEAVQTL